MKSRLFAAVFFAAVVSPVHISSAQNASSPQNVVNELSRSGLTPEQIRARLKASGYPDALLDAYLPGGDTAQRTLPGDSLKNVIRALGLSVASDSTVTSVEPVLPPMPTGPAKTTATSPLPVFGLDVFRRSSSRFQPGLSGSVGPDYRLGPGDVLALILTGDVERAVSLEISRDGFVLIPEVGQVYVANLTLAQADDLLFNRLHRSYGSLGRSAGAATRFYLTVSRLHTNQIFVIGEVRAPGSYQISSVGTVLTALYAAGGPNDNGTLRDVQVRRNGKVVSHVDIYDYLLNGDAAGDIRLESGDVVFTGVNLGRVAVTGQVARPAQYEIKGKETLSDLLQMAGGFTVEAAQQRVQVHRILGPDERGAGGRDRVVLDVSPSDFLAGRAPAFLLRPGDRIEVFGISTRERNRVLVSGNVWNPGVVAFTPGMKLSDALRRSGGVKPDTYLPEVLVTRLESDLTRRSIHTALADTTGRPVNDFQLQDDDEIQIFSRADFISKQDVGISGAVNKSGRFPYHADMSLRELLLLAGGPTEGADLTKVEIARMPDRATSNQVARTFRVSLDSTYAPSSLEPTTAPGAVVFAPVPAGDIKLEPYDNVLILRQPDWEKPGTVTLSGEVRYPGSYTLTRRNEKISDLIKRAGGLTKDADPDAVIFSRADARDTVGRIGVNLRKVLADERSHDNLVLQPGDAISIGQFRPYVRVTGAVNSPTAVPYVSGENLDYYVAAAGGVTTKGDAKRAYVTQPNGTVAAPRKNGFLTDMPVPRAGSVVVVPEKDPEAKRDFAATLGILSGVISSVSVLVALLRR